MISIITPVYNGEEFIETCIKAVINQGCPDIEHIIVDGGSSDQTVNIVKRYGEIYPHIRWISEKDQGQSDAMNKGIILAKGEILGILNVDDYYEPNVLNRVSGLFKELPVPSFLIGNCNVWNIRDQFSVVHKPLNFKFNNMLKGLSVDNFPVNPSAYFYHAVLHQQVGLYKVDEHYAMDLDFLLRAVQVATIHYVNETWGNWVVIEGTKTSTLWASPLDGHRVVDQIIRRYRRKLPLLQRLQVTIPYELNGFWIKYLRWRPEYYFKTYLMMPKNILPAISSKLAVLLDGHGHQISRK
jgi:glycosyltransferase involved in cell wall biosynthesis